MKRRNWKVIILGIVMILLAGFILGFVGSSTKLSLVVIDSGEKTANMEVKISDRIVQVIGKDSELIKVVTIGGWRNLLREPKTAEIRGENLIIVSGPAKIPIIAFIFLWVILSMTGGFLFEATAK